MARMPAICRGPPERGHQRARAIHGAARARVCWCCLLYTSMTPKGLARYGRLCGWTLARAHARSGDRIAIAAYLGKSASFDRALVQFSRDYADQNERDYKTLAAAVESGRITAETGL